MTFKEFRDEQLGKKLTYQERGKPEDGGVVVEAELIGAAIYNSETKERHPAFRYRLYRTDGPKKGKAFWTTSFAFKPKPARVIKSLNEISTKTEEGKMLMGAIAKITTESQTDKTPDEVICQIIKLKNKMSF